MINNINVNSEWVNIKNGKTYTILNHTLVKIDGIWLDGILYTTNDSELLFVRSKEDFLLKFKEKISST